MRGRLQNWAFACRMGSVRHSCGSAEKRYHCPQVWDSPAPRRLIDHADADILERAWRALPMKQKMMLKWSYVYPVHPRVAERKAKIHPGTYEAELRLAEFKIAVIVQRMEKKIAQHLDIAA